MVFPLMSWYKQELQVSIRLVSDCLWAQAYVTAFDISLNIFLEARPIVFSADKVLGFINTKMSCQRVVIVLTDKLYLDSAWDKR